MLKLYRPAMKSEFLMSWVVARKPAVFTTALGPNRMPSRLMANTRPFAVSVPRISVGRAQPRDRRGAGLIEAHALVDADIERVPVDDRAVARLVDDHRRTALALDRRAATDHRAAGGSARSRRRAQRQKRRGGEQEIAQAWMHGTVPLEPSAQDEEEPRISPWAHAEHGGQGRRSQQTLPLRDLRYG